MLQVVIRVNTTIASVPAVMGSRFGNGYPVAVMQVVTLGL